MPRQLNTREVALSVALAAALGVAAGSLVSDDSTPARDVPRVERTSTRPSGKPAASEHEVDTLAYHQAVRAHQLDAGLGLDDAGRIRSTDLLSPPVAPGETVPVDVYLDPGLVPTSVTLTGPAVGRFRIEGMTHVTTEDGHVRVMVAATNASSDTLRFTALVGVEPAP